MPAPDRELIGQIHAKLAAAANPERAPAMQAYMKSEMPYLGVPVPAVRSITRQAERSHRPASTGQLVATSTELWRKATHREHRYAATELTNTATARKLRTIATLPMFEETTVFAYLPDRGQAPNRSCVADRGDRCEQC
jgi:hypothetical protein